MRWCHIGNLGMALHQGDWQSFWEVLFDQKEVEPPYAYSGAVVSILMEQLSERWNVGFISWKSLKSFWTPEALCALTSPPHSEHEFVTCLDANEAKSIGKQLEELTPTNEELAATMECYGVRWNDAAIAMREALIFLRFSLQQVSSDEEFLLLLNVGGLFR